MDIETFMRGKLQENQGEELDLDEWDFIMPGVGNTDIYGRGRERALVEHLTGRLIIRYTFTPGR